MISFEDSLTHVNKIYDVFKSFFKEENTDLHILLKKEEYNNDCEHLYDIIIHFPQVTITNEHNKSIDVEDLWVNIPLKPNGTIYYGFSMFGSTYTIMQLKHNYCHSHISGIPYDLEFKKPCLGRGPIRETQLSLMQNSDRMDLWNLFCYELSLYVKTESVSGVPYRYLENVNKEQDIIYTNTKYYGFGHKNALRNNSSAIRKFIEYYLKTQDIPFIFNGDTFALNENVVKYHIDLSNCFIQWLNNSKYLSDYNCKSLFFNYVYKNKSLYKLTGNCISYYPYNNLADCLHGFNNRKCFVFKGEDIRIKIKQNNIEDGYKVITLLHNDVVNYIITKIINILNFTIVKHGEEYFI